MQKIAVVITAKGYTGLTAENIEKALDYYFGSRSLRVSFSVTETSQQMREPDSLKAGDSCPPDVVKSESNLPA